MEEKKDKGYGELIIEAMTNKQEEMTVVELREQMIKRLPEEINNAIAKGKLAYPDLKVFFIECRKRSERIHKQTMHDITIPRETCPTPCFDQSVFRFLVLEDRLEYIWTVPDQLTAAIYRENRMNVPPEEWEALGFVMDYYDGKLEMLARKFNNEEAIFDLALVKDDSMSEVN